MSSKIDTPGPSLLAYLGVLVLLLWASYRQGSKHVFLLCAAVFFIGLGLLSPALHDRSYPPQHLKNLLQKGQLDLNEPCRISGICTKSTIRRGIGEQFELSVEQIENRHAQYATSGKVRLAIYYPKEDFPPAPTSIEPGDRLTVLTNLRVPQNFQNPGQFDSVAFLERQEVFLVGTVKSELLITPVARHQGGWLRNLIWKWRGSLLARLNEAFPERPQDQAVARALLLGEKQGLDPALEEAFQATGIYHVLVVSGQHVAILALSLFVVFKLLRLPRQLSALFVMAGLCLYCGLTEEQPSIVRATLMAGAYLVSLNFDRDRNLLNSLSLAALLILLYDPGWIFDPGFQLSFLSVLTIALIALPLCESTLHPVRAAFQNLNEVSWDARCSPRLADLRVRVRSLLEDIQNRLPPLMHELIPITSRIVFYLAFLLMEVIVVSFAIQVVFVMLMILYFHRVSALAVMLNVIVVPLVGIIVPLGFLCLLASFFSSAVSLFLAELCLYLLRPLQSLALFFSALEWGNYRVATPPAGAVMVYFALLALVLLPLMPRVVRAISACSMGLWLMAIVFYPFTPQLPLDKLQLTLIDVRQGDSILISFPGSHFMLIDGGGLLGRSFGEVFAEEEFDVGERVVSPFLWSLGVRRLDWLVLTHAHHDHMGGLHAILKNFPVGQLWLGKNPNVPEYIALWKEALRKSIYLRNFREGEVVQIVGGSIEFLNPAPNAPMSSTPKNNDSLAFRLLFGDRSFLLTGDIEQKIEDQLVYDGLELKVDVLKVGHHGSRTSTSPQFLAQVQPVWALISVAAHSPFGHPHPQTLQALNSRQIPIFRTDQDGCISVRTNGKSLELMLNETNLQ
ncbi:MAG: DNA internalization-related competence protein ComEC/Rec2 [Terriglobia bacterium]